MNAPEFDDDGYPTKATLAEIREWSPERGYNRLMEFAREAWRYADAGYFRSQKNPPEEAIVTYHDGGTWYRIATAGWSGNESIIEALQDNAIFWLLCWFSSTRGGLYWFEVGATQTTKEETHEREEQSA